MIEQQVKSENYRRGREREKEKIGLNKNNELEDKLQKAESK